jgi:hypothetical protein
MKTKMKTHHALCGLISGLLLLATGTSTAHAALIIGNAGFETPVTPDFQGAPATGIGQEWTFLPGAGVARNGTIGIIAGSGSSGQFGFLASATGFEGIMSQTITFDSAGLYNLSYLEAGRINSVYIAAGSLNYNITIQDGANPAIFSVSDFTDSNEAFTATSYAFTVPTAGAYTLSFTAVGSHDGLAVGGSASNIAAFDNVEITASPVPEPGTTLFGIGCVALAAFRRRRNSAV